MVTVVIIVHIVHGSKFRMFQVQNSSKLSIGINENRIGENNKYFSNAENI